MNYFFDVDGTLAMGDGTTYPEQRKNEIPTKQLRMLKEQGNNVFIVNSNYWCHAFSGFIPSRLFTKNMMPGIPNKDDVNDSSYRTALIKAIIECYGFNKEECVYVGDLPKDKKAAELNGISFVWAEDFK